MYKATFKTEELRSFLETRLAFALKSFVRIGGGGAINFKAERASDGLLFLVKCFVPDRTANYERLISNLKVMEGTKAPLRLFAECCPSLFRGYHVVCLAWQLGETSDASRLTDDEWAAFLSDYCVFSERLQKSEGVIEAELPLADWRDQALAMCRGLRGVFLRPALASLECLDLELRREDLRVVHGDLHTGNVLFRDGAVICFMDIESVTRRPGPADILTYCSYAIERQTSANRQKILSRFGEAVRTLPYRADEWHMAINAAMLWYFRRRTKGFRKCSIITALKCATGLRSFEAFRQYVVKNAAI